MGDRLFYSTIAGETVNKGTSAFLTAKYKTNRTLKPHNVISPLGLYFKPGDNGGMALSGCTNCDTTNAWSLNMELNPLQKTLKAGEGYVGHSENGTYLKFTDQGIEIFINQTKVLTITADNLQATVDIETNKDVKAGNISLKTHVHGGVEPGGGISGGPQEA